MRFRPRAVQVAVGAERGGVDVQDGLEVFRPRLPDLEPVDRRRRLQPARQQPHQRHREQVGARFERQPRGHPGAPLHVALGVERSRALEVGVRARHVGAVPLRVREAGRHHADAAQRRDGAAVRLAEDALHRPRVGMCRPDAGVEHQ